jgi:hypothetical protein
MKRIWKFIKLRLANIMASKCPKCNSGKVHYIYDDFVGSTWVSVYECKNCNSKFI